MLSLMLQLNWWVATGTLILEIGVLGKVVSLIVLSLNPENSFRKKFVQFVNEVRENILDSFNIDVYTEKFLLVCIFLFSLAASVLTLVYSEIFLQDPCALCWWQRVFMYGLVMISGLALFCRNNQEEKSILRYLLTFSIFGLLFALYQHAEQILALYGTHLPCPVSGADCSKMTLFEYSHITFPWMAVVLFAFFIVIILLQRKLRNLN